MPVTEWDVDKIHDLQGTLHSSNKAYHELLHEPRIYLFKVHAVEKSTVAGNLYKMVFLSCIAQFQLNKG
jgi:ethanolamine utilization cobalamin adenosyltransferase